jgi:pyruvate-ferredoxin/flavodoxin oxidoreductase
LAKAPSTFKSVDSKAPEFKGQKFTLQVSVHDCTGCGLCVETCPAKSKTVEGGKAINMAPQFHCAKAKGSIGISSFRCLTRTAQDQNDNARQMQVMRPLFEFSGACPAVETPYVNAHSAFR